MYRHQLKTCLDWEPSFYISCYNPTAWMTCCALSMRVERRGETFSSSRASLDHGRRSSCSAGTLCSQVGAPSVINTPFILLEHDPKEPISIYAHTISVATSKMDAKLVTTLCVVLVTSLLNAESHQNPTYFNIGGVLSNNDSEFHFQEIIAHLNFANQYVPKGVTYYATAIQMDANPIRTALNSSEGGEKGKSCGCQVKMQAGELRLLLPER
uniref:Uncharacterized protein n=1 Tax=Timema tahoe TaxID=61484 RepID=A0A7R9FKU3_9NEOP|nr:unnamed protein product [Timema tahoe]